MYYLNILPQRNCEQCGRRADYELKTSGTVSRGYYCKRCGEREVTERNKQDKEDEEEACHTS